MQRAEPISPWTASESHPAINVAMQYSRCCWTKHSFLSCVLTQTDFYRFPVSLFCVCIYCFDSSHYQRSSPKHVSVYLSTQGQTNRIFLLNFLSRLCAFLSSPRERFGVGSRCNHNACCFHASNRPAHPLGRRPQTCLYYAPVFTSFCYGNAHTFPAWKAPGFSFCAFQLLLMWIKRRLMYQTRLYTLLGPSLLLLSGIVYCNANKDRE